MTKEKNIQVAGREDIFRRVEVEKEKIIRVEIVTENCITKERNLYCIDGDEAARFLWMVEMGKFLNFLYNYKVL